MSTVTPTTPTTATSTAAKTTTATAATVDYNSFLKLMIAELKNQDPTAPADPTTFMSQLASFSNVEQAVQSNTKLDAILTTTSLSQAESVIGRTVSGPDGTSGKVVSVSLGAAGAATATLANGSTLALSSGVTVSGS